MAKWKLSQRSYVERTTPILPNANVCFMKYWNPRLLQPLTNWLIPRCILSSRWEQDTSEFWRKWARHVSVKLDTTAHKRKSLGIDRKLPVTDKWFLSFSEDATRRSGSAARETQVVSALQSSVPLVVVSICLDNLDISYINLLPHSCHTYFLYIRH